MRNIAIIGAGQGANNATKMAHLVKQRIIEHGNQPFDKFWMKQVFDQFWNYWYSSRNRFSRMKKLRRRT